MLRFGKHEARGVPEPVALIGQRWEVEFPNGWGASIIRGPCSFGLFEIAPLERGEMNVDVPPWGGDPLRRDTADEIGELLDVIAALPPLERGS